MPNTASTSVRRRRERADETDEPFVAAGRDPPRQGSPCPSRRTTPPADFKRRTRPARGGSGRVRWPDRATAGARPAGPQNRRPAGVPWHWHAAPARANDRPRDRPPSGRRAGGPSKGYGRLASAGTARAASFAVEHQDRLAGERAVLGAAEGEHVDAGFVAHRRRRAAERHERIGEARPIHMHRQARLMGDVRQHSQFRQRVDGAALGRLRQAEAGRLSLPRNRRGEAPKGRPKVHRGRSCRPNLQPRPSLPPFVKNSGAAHSSSMMCAAVWQKTTPAGRYHGAKRKRIGRRPGRH